ncbi:MAG TPA: tetratricopeptide repeat protein [Candidatus Limnocylindria bacterium]|jgi:tetratricopeptide (TPR) repeat protein|nr:tetratricopeptide repeat protein [Candidatus Limnocylindria bacterium]
MPRTRTSARATEKDRDLARRIGQRIREARLRAGLTQQQLAGERYTKAYVSALETGIARPSMVALSYLSERLGFPASHFIDEAHPAWTRLEVDMRLAAGDWQAAADGYRSLLADAGDEATRADLLRGLAEASARLDQGKDAIAAASEAARIYAAAGRETDAALARYWLAYGLYQSDSEIDARSVLLALLDQVRSGLRVEPDFEMRLLTSLAAVESRAGQPTRALTYLEEARGLAADLDDRRRAAFLFNLAISYREIGDFEAAIRAGTQGMALYRAAGAIFESARIENDLALAYLATGQIERAHELAGDARRQIEDTGDERWMASVVDTEAQVALARGNVDEALGLAAKARDYAQRSGNEFAGLMAMLTEARALRRAGRPVEAEARFGEAAALARSSKAPNRLREVLREWADLRAESGDHRGAYELTSEALAVN